MVEERNRFSWFLFISGTLFSCYLGYVITYIFMGSIQGVSVRMISVIKKPIANYKSEYTLKGILISFIIFCLVYFFSVVMQRNYMFGKEHGTSKWISAQSVTKELTTKNSQNKIITENLQIAMDSGITNLNNNSAVIGGSGKGKSFNYVIPNLLKGLFSCVVTDPKGELLKKTGKKLKKKGYEIKVINLVKMGLSNCYNPFKYVRSEEDVTKLINNLIQNTTPKGAEKGDPFWEKSESLYLQSLFYYVWMEMPPNRRNFNELLSLLSKAEVKEDSLSELDMLMHQLSIDSPLGENHPAVRSYYKCIRGAGDTVRSIIISANSRMAFFETKGIQRILGDDEMDLASIGIGKNGDKKTKTAIFCVIPDNDKSYNFIVGMLYTQLFQELYYQADNNFDGELPIPVEFWMDEFANVALPDQFESLLSTMRSRLISCNIIIQNLTQLKVLFKDSWESILGNCDTLLYLGGNEQSSHKYISESLGSKTIDKRTSGVNRGRSGGSSNNYDVMERVLMTPAEVRKLKRNKAIVLVSGLDPIYDEKYRTKKHVLENGLKKFEIYIHENKKKIESLEFLSEASMEYYETAALNGENIKIINLTIEDIMSLPDDYDFSNHNEESSQMEKEEIREQETQSEREFLFNRLKKQICNKLEERRFKKKNVLELVQEMEFTKEQIFEIKEGLRNGLTEEMVKEYMNLELSAGQMEQKRLYLEYEQNVYKNIA